MTRTLQTVPSSEHELVMAAIRTEQDARADQPPTVARKRAREPRERGADQEIWRHLWPRRGCRKRVAR